MTQLPDLAADCDACAALCCVGLAFDEGDDFAIDKPAGLPCPNLSGHLCGIYSSLTDAGFPGCAQYDCQGAGQIVTRDIFGGGSWQDKSSLAGPMMEAFATLRAVQDMRAQLQAAAGFDLDDAQETARQELEDLLTPDWSRETFAAFDLPAARDAFNDFLADLRRNAAVLTRRE